MAQWIRSRFNHLHPNLQFLLTMLLISAFIFGTLSVLGCGDCGCGEEDQDPIYSSPNSRTGKAASSTVRGYMTRYNRAGVAGDTEIRTIRVQQETAGAPDKVNIAWMPPAGVTDITWGIGSGPTNPNGPPPYIWSDFNTNDTIEVSFTLPPVPEGEVCYTATDTLHTSYHGGTATTETMDQTVVRDSGAENAAPLAMAPASVTTDALVETAEEIDVWQTQKYFDPKGIALTTETCQEWIDILSDDAFFFAVQIPISASGAVTESQTLSLVIGDETPATVDLEIWGSGTPYTAEAELRLERGSFMANELPATEGRAWVALGLPDDAPACPAGLNAQEDRWSIITSLTLDLRTLPDGGEGSHITSYYCYEGQTPPGDDTPAESAYQGENITCLGPNVLYFRTYPSAWEFSGASHGTVAHESTLQFHHYVSTTGASVTLTPTIESDLNAGWALYRGDHEAPNLSQPITGPLTASGHVDVWLVSEPIDAGVEDGPYSVQVTMTNAASPDDAQTMSDTIWVGGWAAPPKAPANPYLPLVIR